MEEILITSKTLVSCYQDALFYYFYNLWLYYGLIDVKKNLICGPYFFGHNYEYLKVIFYVNFLFRFHYGDHF